MTKRCFIALNLPPKARWQMESLITDLTKLNDDKNIKFVNPRQVHVTLHFLGNLDGAQIETVKKIISQAVPSCHQAEIMTGQIIAFPDWRQPHVICLNCREAGQKPLAKLRAEISRHLPSAKINIEDTKWQPHITLARLKGPCRFRADGIGFSELSILLNQVDLMSSELTPDGPNYNIIQSYSLAN